jgi:RNA polymerase sigma-70 factor (ECF subfamily)
VDLRRHYRDVYRYVRRRSRNDADAEDITQEVFADAARALDRFKPGSPPLLAWLYTVAQRRLADAGRRQGRRPELGDERALELVVAPAPEYGSEAAAALGRGLAQLPLLQRQVVTMKLISGMSFAEIAQATRSSEGACRMRFLRGLEQLRDYLEEEGIAP